MGVNEYLGQAIDRIIKELNIVDPTFGRTTITSFGAEVDFGNLKVKVYYLDKNGSTSRYHSDVAAAKDFGKGLAYNEHYVRQGMFGSGNPQVGWFATVKNEILD